MQGRIGTAHNWGTGVRQSLQFKCEAELSSDIPQKRFQQTNPDEQCRCFQYEMHLVICISTPTTLPHLSPSLAFSSFRPIFYTPL